MYTQRLIHGLTHKCARAHIQPQKTHPHTHTYTEQTHTGLRRYINLAVIHVLLFYFHSLSLSSPSLFYTDGHAQLIDTHTNTHTYTLRARECVFLCLCFFGFAFCMLKYIDIPRPKISTVVKRN